MRESRLWHRLLGVDRTVVEGVEADPAGRVVVAHVRPVARARQRCGRCGGRATLRHGVTNALAESVNAKIRLITRRAFGFRDVHALIALAMLSLGGYRPDLPGR